jgi:hypothetical protein
MLASVRKCHERDHVGFVVVHQTGGVAKRGRNWSATRRQACEAVA